MPQNEADGNGGGNLFLLLVFDGEMVQQKSGVSMGLRVEIFLPFFAGKYYPSP